MQRARAYIANLNISRQKLVTISIVGVVVLIIVVIGIVLLGLWLGGVFGGGGGSHNGGNGGSSVVSNITFGKMVDPSTQRNVYGFSWTPPGAAGSYCYQYTITDVTMNSVLGTENTTTTNSYALLQPYGSVSIGHSYRIDVQCSDPSTIGPASCSVLGPSVSYKVLFNPTPEKPVISYEVQTGSGTTCDTWLHVVPTNYFAMIGSYNITVLVSQNGDPYTISEITYDNLPMMNDPTNLQYTIPFFYTTQPTQPIYISAVATNTVGNTTISGTCTLPAPNTSGINCSSKTGNVGQLGMQQTFADHMDTNELFPQDYYGTPYAHGSGCVGDEYKLYRYW